MSEWEVYWWLKLSDFRGILMIGSSLIGSAIFAGALIPTPEKPRRLFWLLPLLPLLITGFVLPSTQQYAVIKVLPKIVNSDFAQEAVGDARMIYDVAKNYLKETLKVEAPDAKA